MYITTSKPSSLFIFESIPRWFLLMLRRWRFGHLEVMRKVRIVSMRLELFPNCPVTASNSAWSLGMETVSQGLEDGVWGQLFALWDFKNSNRVFLRDKILNGTWINRNRIGNWQGRNVAAGVQHQDLLNWAQEKGEEMESPVLPVNLCSNFVRN